MKSLATEMKVGLFALVVIGIIIFATMRVSQEGLFSTGTYTIYAELNSAEGLTPKTPVEIAGIQVGTLGKAELIDNRVAKVAIHVRKGVKLSSDVSAQVRTKGFLGESYIDLQQGQDTENFLAPGDSVKTSNSFADLSQLSSKMNDIADDVSEMTASVKGLFSSKDGDAPVTQIVHNMRDFTRDLKEFTQVNRGDMNRVVSNLAALTNELRVMVQHNRGNFDNSMGHLRSIAQKIDEGRGTLGRLINDESTIDGLNKAVDNLNETLGGFSSMQFNMGYHLEYLGKSNEFKNYVHLDLRTRPNRAFLFEFVADSSPTGDREKVVSDVTTGGTTTTVITERRITKRDQFRFSAQIAQDFYDFTFRGGIIESRAGIGMDWSKGPFTASVSAWDFTNEGGTRPHLKAWGRFDVTRNLFVLGGIDDPLNPLQATDWFVGAGMQFRDNDIKSLLGLGAAAR